MHKHEAGSEVVVMVVGAGRGPLVAATLAAGVSSGRRVRVFAVEKNPNAVVTLRGRCAREAGWSEVTVIPGDMREWQSPIEADLLVSELLGSWGEDSGPFEPAPQLIVCKALGSRQKLFLAHHPTACDYRHIDLLHDYARRAIVAFALCESTRV